MNSQYLRRSAAMVVVAMGLLAGCKSKEDAALDQAKKQAAATGQAQQVISVDKNGNTVTTTVQPPAPGQTGQAVTTTVTPPANAPGAVPANQPAVAGGVAANQPAVAGGAAPAEPAPAAPVNQTATTGNQTATPGNPVVRPADVNVPAGTNLAIVINQHISVKTSHAGDRFTGEMAEAVTKDGRVIIPRGAPVSGVVDAAHRRGHFKGASLLELRLTSLTLNGTKYPLETRDLTRTKKGKGKRSAAMIGGGAGLGMLIGGIATGGTGLLIGGLAGGGAGTALGGLTGNRDIEIPAESVVRFKLADDLTLQP